MISWTEYRERELRTKERIAQKQLQDKYFVAHSEMCDCCGKNKTGIRRASYYSETGMLFVIRYCETCNPNEYWKILNL